MPHLNVYLPEELAKKVKNEARQRKISLSAFVTNVLRERVSRKGWRKGFFTDVVGAWQGEFPKVRRPSGEKRAAL